MRAPITSITAASCAAVALLAGPARSFAPPSPRRPLARRPSPSATSVHATAKPNELFDSAGWDAIKAELDQVPIFAVANEQGQPIKYSIASAKKDVKVELPLFYTHVDDALAELEKARENNDFPGMDINPYPLGGIFEMWAKDSAVIVPNKKSIVMAGSPPNANPIGQQVPLFACMEIAQETEEGKPVLPLFFELEDAQDAVKEAVAMDGGKEEDFEVVGLNLPEAVSLLTNAKDEATAFQFIPPESSLKHIRDYFLSGG